MKKILAMMLAVALVASLAVPALAVEYTDVYHCECGAKWYASAEEATPSVKNGTCMEGCDGSNLTWKPMTAQPCEMIDGQWIATTGTAEWVPHVDYNFYLVGNLETTYKLKIGDTAQGAPEGSRIRIDLNGFDYYRTKNTAFQITGASHLVITDTSANKTGRIFANEYSAGGQNIVQLNGGTVKQYAGTIDGQYIAAKGTYIDSDNATNVRVDASGTYYMYNGAIVNGKYKTGGNVIVKGTFNMYGGTVKDGTATGTATHHGGNFRVDGGTLNVYGGIIKDGTAKANAGNIMMTNSAKVNIYSGAQILGGSVAATGYGAGIWCMAGTTLKVYGGYVEKDIYVSGTAEASGDQLTLTGDLNLSAPLNIAENVTINLAGHKIANGVNVAEGVVLTLVDTSTDDYETAGAMLKVTGEGTVKSDAVVNSKRYVAIKETVNEDTYYSAHRIYLAVTSSVLSNGSDSMNFKTVLKCNNYVAMRVEEYGVTVNGNFVAYENADLVAGGDLNQKTTQLTGFLKGDAGDADFAATDVQVSATIKLGEEDVINSAVKTRSLKTMVETVVEGWADLDADQQTTLKNLYKDFGATAGMDSWNIPAEMKAN